MEGGSKEEEPEILFFEDKTPGNFSKKSTSGGETEEILFFEDKIPGNLSKKSNSGGKTEDILFFEDKTPGNFSKKSNSGKKTEDILFFDDRRNRTSTNSCTEEGECDEVDCEEDEIKNKSSLDSKTSNNPPLVDDFLLVIEDRNPLLSCQETPSPRYSINEKFLQPQEDGTPQAKRSKFVNTCWNCGETTHSVASCPEPRDPTRIARGRREFMMSKSSQPVYKRYHVEEEQRFGHLVPGQLSDRLRIALGLEPGQLPLHVYKMRLLGYPPGWLLEAKVSHSGIAMFDGQGKEINDPDMEVGEVVEEGSKDKYDINKIIHYPGFNVPPPPNTHDDSAYWRCPPQSQMQSVDMMVAKLEGRIVKGYKRKKLSLAPADTVGDSSMSEESREMEYEEIPESKELPEDDCKFVPPLPEEDLPPPPPTDLPEEPPEADISSQNLSSSSIEESSLPELEETKKRLLAQLNDTKDNLCSTPESRVGRVKSVDLGTPLLKSVSPYARLPSVEKFSVNICDVINFENLPDSTGKYEQMTHILRKVRVKLSELNNDET